MHKSKNHDTYLKPNIEFSRCIEIINLRSLSIVTKKVNKVLWLYCLNYVGCKDDDCRSLEHSRIRIALTMWDVKWSE